MVRTPSALTTVGLCTLVLADVALVTLAVLHVQGANTSSADVVPAPADAASSGRGGEGHGKGGHGKGDPGKGDPGKGDHGKGDPGREAAATTSTGAILLDAAADGTVLRAERGGCAGSDIVGVPVQVSTNGGRRFEVADVSDEPLADVLRVATSGANDLFLVGADGHCATAVYRSRDGGETWDRSAGTGGAWHLLSGPSTFVHAPSGVITTSCEVAVLSPLSTTSARVLCTDGELRGTDDSGSSWVQLGRLDGAVDVSYVSPVAAWALAVTEACPAALLRTDDGGSDWERVACVDEDGSAPQAVSAVRQATGETMVTVQVDGQVRASTDGGETLTRP